MVLKIGEFEIYTYDKKDDNQRHLKYVLNNDSDFCKYVTKNVQERLEESSDREKLEFNNSYLVKYKDDFIGYICLEELMWNGTLNIEYAISPEFRNQNFGKRVLETISNYILENIEEVKKIRGVIDRSNYSSKMVASQVGFNIESRDDNYIYVSKTR